MKPEYFYETGFTVHAFRYRLRIRPYVGPDVSSLPIGDEETCIGWPGLVSKGNDGPSGVSSKDSRFPSYPNAGSSPIYLGKEMTL
jgi:hypothetical protein